jgi:hypothetical protein
MREHEVRRIVWAGALAATVTMGCSAGAQDKPGFTDTPMLPGGKWHVHDPDRPLPVVVTPAATLGGPPADAIVLFDGTSSDAWTARQVPWLVADGAMTVPSRPEGGGDNNLVSKQSFGDVQLHLEFRAPNPPAGTSQDRGNSGIFFMQRYEVQVLDVYQNETYADGTLGAIYGWKPPLANPARAPGEWQSYDIVFERPRFAADGTLLKPAYVTVFLNGVLLHNHQPFLGATGWRQVAQYTAHPDAAPIELQDHGSPVSYRNIWVRPLPEAATDHDLESE